MQIVIKGLDREIQASVLTRCLMKRCDSPLQSAGGFCVMTGFPPLCTGNILEPPPAEFYDKNVRKNKDYRDKNMQS